MQAFDMSNGVLFTVFVFFFFWFFSLPAACRRNDGKNYNIHDRKKNPEKKPPKRKYINIVRRVIIIIFFFLLFIYLYFCGKQTESFTPIYYRNNKKNHAATVVGVSCFVYFILYHRFHPPR